MSVEKTGEWLIIELPVAIDGENHALAWRARIERAQKQLDVLARQVIFHEWIAFLRDEPLFKGLAWMSGSQDYVNDGDTGSGSGSGSGSGYWRNMVQLGFEDGSLVAHKSSWETGKTGVMRRLKPAVSGDEKKEKWERCKAYDQVLNVVDEKLRGFLGEDWTDVIGEDKPVVPTAEAWRDILFTTEDIASWEAGLISAGARQGHNTAPKRI